MTYLAKPKLHHPRSPRTASATPAATTKARSRRCAPAAATTRSRRRSSRPAGNSTSSRTASPSCRESAARRRPRLLPRQLARFQHRARTHAVGAHRRLPGQPRTDLPRRLGRRRLGVDRPRPVCPRHAPRRQHDLPGREQRRLRTDQGTVLGDRRQGLEVQEGADQQRRADRPGRRSRW
jgi:hypothetical protein